MLWFLTGSKKHVSIADYTSGDFLPPIYAAKEKNDETIMSEYKGADSGR